MNEKDEQNRTDGNVSEVDISAEQPQTQKNTILTFDIDTKITGNQDMDGNQEMDDQQRSETISRIPRSETKSSFKEACVNFYKGSMGAGVLATPFAIASGGWILGLAMFIVVPVLILYSTQMLVRIVDEDFQRPSIGLSEATRLLLGDKAVNWIKMFLILLQWGCCASYILFFMQFFEYAFYNQIQISFVHQLIYLSIAFCLILPMTLIDNIAVFAKYSVLASVLTVIVLIAILIYSITNLIENDVQAKLQAHNMVTFKYLPLQAGISIFAFEGIGLVFSIRSSMVNEKQFPKVITTICSWIIVQNLLIGMVSSFSFGVATQQIILLSLPRSWLSSVFQILYSLALLISFPLQLLPAFQQFERIDILKRFIQTNASGYVIRRTIIRTIQVIMIAGIAISIPQFAILLSFMGGLAGAALQFWFPMLVYIRHRWNKDNFLQKSKMMTSSIIGIVLGSIAMIDSLILTFS